MATAQFKSLRVIPPLLVVLMAAGCGSGSGGGSVAGEPPPVGSPPPSPPPTPPPSTPPPGGDASPVITGVTFDETSHRRDAQGSDNWPLTWSSDGNQYAIWGDGGGFGGTENEGRASLGVARIEGDGHNYRGVNRFGG